MTIRKTIAYSVVRAPFVGLSLLVSCTNNPITSNPSENEVLLPLSSGNSWFYVTYTYMGDSVIPGLTDSNRTTIIGQTIVYHNGQQYDVSIAAFFYPSNAAQPVDSKWLYWNGNDGLYILGGLASKDTLIDKLLYLKYPVARGDTWIAPHLTYDLILNRFFVDDTLSYNCVSTDEELVTPAGTFQCYVYHHRIRPEEDVLEYWDYYEYYALGIGKVGTIIRSSLDGSMKSKSLLYLYVAE
jgi:hypothetical protein